MADLCFICNESLSQGDPSNVVRGLKILKEASIQRNDGHIDFLKSSTPENVHTKCQHRNDTLKTANIYQHLVRISERSYTLYDLIASEAKYHTLYYANFLNRLPSTEKKHRQDNQVSEAMAESFNYIKNHDDSQSTLKELRDVLTGDPEEERLRIVEAAAAIIREDIRSSVVETKSYPPPRCCIYGGQQCSLGFAASYGNTVHFEISTAYHPQPRILSSELGALLQYAGDNANINVYTLDGNNTPCYGND
ncbi:uncharacterized protein TNIN_66801 [Trichonephila inaurata madagascariensis]|uniref:Uncharacterized protein n=1 Tax=Trichonephila inaurata madagascariensis TaxID=2747483 RepID=A0A8X6X2A8_9ARAC|nr:uncharacterized protein TNIN_66801 [Trichonephila inaurata madagascariensis]